MFIELCSVIVSSFVACCSHGLDRPLQHRSPAARQKQRVKRQSLALRSPTSQQLAGFDSGLGRDTLTGAAAVAVAMPAVPVAAAAGEALLELDQRISRS